MQEFLAQISQNHFVLAPLVFILLRALCVIFPPLPGFIFDLAGIAVFGKFFGFVLAQIGVMAGASAAFLISRYFQGFLIKRSAFLQGVNKWASKLSSKKQFLSLTILRLLTNPFFDFISYAAGLVKMRFSIFFLASFLGSLPTMFLFYFFGGYVWQKGIGYFSIFAVIALALGLFAKKWYNS